VSLLTAAQTAAAAPELLRVPDRLAGGPTLAAGGAVVVDRDRRLYEHARYLPLDGGRPRTLAQFAPVFRLPVHEDRLHLAGSDRWIVMGSYDHNLSGYASPGVLLASKPAAPVAELARCDLEGDEWAPQVDGDHVVFRGPASAPCEGDRGAQVRDLREPARGVTFGPREWLVRDLAYPYVAFATDNPTDENGVENFSEVGVYDLEQRREVLRVRDSPRGKFADPPYAVVDSDGTIVVAYAAEGANTCHTLAASPRSPEPRELPYRRCAGLLELQNGMLAFEQALGRGGVRARVAVGTLEGASARPLTAPYDSEERGDFDGQHMATVRRSCLGRRLIAVDDVARALRDGPAPLGSCPARLRAAHSPVDARGRLRAAVTCPRGCVGSLQLRRGRRIVDLPIRSSRFRVGPGSTTRLAPKVPRYELRARPRPVTLVASVLQPDGIATDVERPIVLPARTSRPGRPRLARAIEGTAYNDELVGTYLGDVIHGFDGNDLLVGHGGADRLFGNSGRDLLEGGGDRDTLVGGEGDDRLEAGERADSVFGGPGDDYLSGDGSEERRRDFLSGGSGSDIVVGDADAPDLYGAVLVGGGGPDDLTAGQGSNHVVAGPGADTVDTANGAVDRIECGAGLDRATVDRHDSTSGCERVRLSPSPFPVVRPRVGGPRSEFELRLKRRGECCDLLVDVIGPSRSCSGGRQYGYRRRVRLSARVLLRGRRTWCRGRYHVHSAVYAGDTFAEEQVDLGMATFTVR
jgi:hypothetical protein